MNSDVAKKYGTLIERLFHKTQAKEISWELGENRSPKAKLGQYNITLFEGHSGGNPVEYVSLSTLYDESIETISDEDLTDFSPKGSEHDSYWPMMEELRHLAFRQAVGADKALDDILDRLDDLDL